MAKTVGAVLSLKDKFSTPLKDIATKLGTTEKELKKATYTVKKFQDQLGNGIKKAAIIAGAGITAIAAGLMTAGLSWARLASDAEETNNKISVVFGKSSNILQKWASNSIKKMGLAGQSALDSAALFGDMARGMNIPEKTAATMSMTLTQLSADLASFKNIRQDVAKTALNGVFSGETESLKQLGIVMTEANLQEYAHSKGIQKKIKDMKEAEKVQLRYNYILSKTKLAQGDFERTGGGAANQGRMFDELKLQIGSNLGKIFLPEFTKGLKLVNSLLVTNMPRIQAVVQQAYNGIGNSIKFVRNNLKWIIPLLITSISLWTSMKIINGVAAVITTCNTVLGALNTTQGINNALLLSNCGLIKLCKNAIIIWNAAGVLSVKIQQLFLGQITLTNIAVVAWANICKAATAVQWLFNAALNANPVGLVVVGIGLLVAAGIALYKNWGKICKKAAELWDWLKRITGFGKKTISVDAKINKTDDNKPVNNKIPHHSLGSAYFSGGITHISENGRGETAILPKSTKILSHNDSKKGLKGNISINLGGIHIQGNMIGNEEFVDYMGAKITKKVKLALANI